MTRRERLIATLAGKTVDRPAVNFYEINGLDEFRGVRHGRQPTDRPNDFIADADGGSSDTAAGAGTAVPGADGPAVTSADPFDIYADPSWRPLIELARDRTDRIVMRSAGRFPILPEESRVERTPIPTGELIRSTIDTGARRLTSQSRRDFDVNTVWTVEHLLKDIEDVKAFLSAPAADPPTDIRPVISSVERAEAALGDSGIVMLDTPDPLCLAAALFEMADYTVIALTEEVLFRRLLDRFADLIYPQVRAVSRALPGRLWRVYGPEYASPPYLPPRLFREYVGRYDSPIVEAIHAFGGSARIHSHGNLREILPIIAETDWDAIDPIEPPPQGDVSLQEVAAAYGDRWVLFGNLEISDIENLPPAEFRRLVARALREGQGGRGFVLMPSSCPYGRNLAPRTVENYRLMVELAESS